MLRSAASSSPRSAPGFASACFMTSDAIGEAARRPARARDDHRPLRQSRMSPAAFTTASADTTTSPT